MEMIARAAAVVNPPYATTITISLPEQPQHQANTAVNEEGWESRKDR